MTQRVDEYMQLDWAAGDISAAFISCPLCGATDDKALVVSVPNPYVPGTMADWFRCDACGSLVSDTQGFAEFTESGDRDDVGWRHYVQIGAGIDVMVRPLERVRGDRRPSLLDVGCGFGLTLDYWRHAVGAEAVGVEPSRFGELGGRTLGVELHVALLQDVIRLRGLTFDIVFSSEVIEHVPDPAAFIADLRGHLAPGGVLVLTTPNAGYVAPEHPVGMVLGVLSPGLHKFLFSPAALEAALRRAGFPNVMVETHAERLIAFAGDALVAAGPSPDTLRARYVSYVAARALDPDLTGDVAIGFGYRALKELVNEGRIAEAVPIGDRVRVEIRALFGFDPLDADAVRAAVLPCHGMAEYEKRAPFSLGCLLYFRAMATRQGAWPGEDAQMGFRLSHEVMSHSLRMAPEYFQEAEQLVWSALLEEGFAALVAARRQEALDCFDRLLAVSGPVAVPASVLTRAHLHKATAHLYLDDPAAAIMAFGAYFSSTSPDANSTEYAQALDLLDQATATLRSRSGLTQPRPANSPINLIESKPAETPRAGLLRRVSGRLAGRRATSPSS